MQVKDIKREIFSAFFCLLTLLMTRDNRSIICFQEFQEPRKQNQLVEFRNPVHSFINSLLFNQFQIATITKIPTILCSLDLILTNFQWLKYPFRPFFFLTKFLLALWNFCAHCVSWTHPTVIDFKMLWCLASSHLHIRRCYNYNFKTPY